MLSEVNLKKCFYFLPNALFLFDMQGRGGGSPRKKGSYLVTNVELAVSEKIFG